MKQYALQPEFKYIHYLHKLNILQTITKVQKEKILPLQQLLGFGFITTGQTGLTKTEGPHTLPSSVQPADPLT